VTRFRRYVCWISLLSLPFLVVSTPRVEGLVILFFGAAIRIYASGYIEKNQKLSTGGPFAYVRNPLYLGTLIMAFGVALAVGSPWAVFGVFCVGGPLFLWTARAEERFLEERFSEVYRSYRKEVPRFFPRMYRPGVSAAPFSRELFLKNKGYEAGFAALGLVALLYIIARVRATDF